MGGFFPSFMAEECLKHADSVNIGEGEPTWPIILEDARRGALKPKYHGGHSLRPGADAHPPPGDLLRRRDLRLGRGPGAGDPGLLLRLPHVRHPGPHGQPDPLPADREGRRGDPGTQARERLPGGRLPLLPAAPHARVRRGALQGAGAAGQEVLRLLDDGLERRPGVPRPGRQGRHAQFLLHDERRPGVDQGAPGGGARAPASWSTWSRRSRTGERASSPPAPSAATGTAPASASASWSCSTPPPSAPPSSSSSPPTRGRRSGTASSARGGSSTGPGRTTTAPTSSPAR